MAKTNDASHLTVLAVCYWVLAAIEVCAGVLLGAYAAFLPWLFERMPPPRQLPSGQMEPDPREFAWLIQLALGIGGLWAIATAVLLALAAISIARRRWRIFCMIVGGLICLSFPLGTALGIFTLVVLSRQSVADLFARGGGAKGWEPSPSVPPNVPPSVPPSFPPSTPPGAPLGPPPSMSPTP